MCCVYACAQCMCVRVCVVRVCLSEDAEQPLVHWVLNDIVVTLEEQPRFPPSLSVLKVPKEPAASVPTLCRVLAQRSLLAAAQGGSGDADFDCSVCFSEGIFWEPRFLRAGSTVSTPPWKREVARAVAPVLVSLLETGSGPEFPQLDQGLKLRGLWLSRLKEQNGVRGVPELSAASHEWPRPWLFGTSLGRNSVRRFPMSDRTCVVSCPHSEWLVRRLTVRLPRTNSLLIQTPRRVLLGLHRAVPGVCAGGHGASREGALHHGFVHSSSTHTQRL